MWSFTISTPVDCGSLAMRHLHCPRPYLAVDCNPLARRHSDFSRLTDCGPLATSYPHFTNSTECYPLVTPYSISRTNLPNRFLVAIQRGSQAARQAATRHIVDVPVLSGRVIGT